MLVRGMHRLDVSSMSREAVEEMKKLLTEMKIEYKEDAILGYIVAHTSKLSDIAAEADKRVNERKYGKRMRTVRVRTVEYEDIAVPEELIKECRESGRYITDGQAEALAAEKVLDRAAARRKAEPLIVLSKGISSNSYAGAGRDRYEDPDLFDPLRRDSEDSEQFILDLR